MELSNALKKIKFSITKKFINPKNPIHKLFLNNLQKNSPIKNSLQIFNLISKQYINNKFDISLPISFSGVRITDELPFLDYLEKNKNILVKSYSIYRQGRLQEAFDKLKNLYTGDAILLKLIISIYLKKNFFTLFKYKFNKNKIKTNVDYEYKKNFLKNFYLKKFSKKDSTHYKYLSYKLTVKNFLKNKIITKELLKYKKFLLTDLHFTRGLAKSVSNSEEYLKIFKKIFYSNHKIFYTSEVFSGYILSLYLEKNFKLLNKYYSKELIMIDKFKKKDLGPIIKDLNFNSKKFIPDFNTSNLNGRFYSTNLDTGYKINVKFKKKLQSLTKKFLHLYSKKLNYIKKLNKKNSSLWYDYSCNKKTSIIKEHLHTAGLHRANIFTIVLYLNVPQRKKHIEGNLRVFDKEIPIFDKFIEVKTGCVVAFPSYFFHETTPTKTQYLRKTINSDYVVKLQKIKL